MLRFKTITPRYRHSVSIFDLPVEMQGWARAWANADGEILDYQDGNFYVPIDLQSTLADTTPDDKVQAVLDGDLAEDSYPVAWREEADTFEDYAALKRWQDVARYIRENLPRELVSENKVALYVCH